MRKHLRNPRVWIVLVLLVAAWLLWPKPASSPLPNPPPPPAQSASRDAPARLPAPAAEREVEWPASALPGEAHATVRLIQNGGPFAHRQDGGVFGNREGRLPQRPRGYYREYTVATPGLSHRGARRIVTGGDPPEVWYYTEDHYDSFRALAVAPAAMVPDAELRR